MDYTNSKAVAAVGDQEIHGDCDIYNCEIVKKEIVLSDAEEWDSEVNSGSGGDQSLMTDNYMENSNNEETEGPNKDSEDGIESDELGAQMPTNNTEIFGDCDIYAVGVKEEVWVYADEYDDTFPVGDELYK
ncbi:unnamed protein product [Orchesella dallaii]|uniref:Uncharacterized protein n=1 Tax=Orchesella dallaii TaxID=48710 RepID=A0ABP1PYJ6_9HEXA